MNKLLLFTCFGLLAITFSCTVEEEIPAPVASVQTLEDILAANKSMYETKIINRWWKYFYNPDSTNIQIVRLDSAMFVPTAPDKGNFFKSNLTKPYGTYTIPLAPGKSILDYSILTLFDSTGAKVYTVKMSINSDSNLIFTNTETNSKSKFYPR